MEGIDLLFQSTIFQMIVLTACILLVAIAFAFVMVITIYRFVDYLDRRRKWHV